MRVGKGNPSNSVFPRLLPIFASLLAVVLLFPPVLLFLLAFTQREPLTFHSLVPGLVCSLPSLVFGTAAFFLFRLIDSDYGDDQREVGRLLDRLAFPHLLRRARREYEDGATLDFRGSRLGRQGIICREDTLPWDWVGEVALEQGKVVVRHRGLEPWAESPAGAVDNLAVFLAMSRQLRR